MRFLRTAVMALSATQAAALSSKDIVAAIDGITQLSNETTQITTDINPGNLVQTVPKLVGDFKDLVVMALETVEKVGTSVATTKLEDSGQEDICQAFHDFVKVHQNLLQTVIGQGGILSKSPISAPLGAIVSVLEGGVDTLADSLFGLIPTCKDQAKKDLMALDKTLDMTIDQLASQVPGAKPLIDIVNNFVKGLTGGIGGAASTIIDIFTGKAGGPLGAILGGGSGGGSGSNPLGGIFGGGSSSGKGGNGGIFGGIFGGGNSNSGGSMPGGQLGGLTSGLTGGSSSSGSSGSESMSGSNNMSNSGSLPSSFPSGFPDVSGSSSSSIAGQFPKGPNGKMPSVKKDNMGGYYVCYHLENTMA